MSPESLKHFTVPSVFNRNIFIQLNLIRFLLVKGARHHYHICADITAESSSFACVQRLRKEFLTIVYRTWYIAAIHSRLIESKHYYFLIIVVFSTILQNTISSISWHTAAYAQHLYITTKAHVSHMSPELLTYFAVQFLFSILSII